MIKRRLTLKILLFLVFSDVLETLTHFCFKKGAESQSYLDIATFSDGVVFILGVFSSPFLWLGLISVACTFIVWSTILSKIDLSVAVPIASFSYIMIPLVSALFLGEEVSLLRWAGVLCILIGVVFVSLSTHEKEIIRQ